MRRARRHAGHAVRERCGLDDHMPAVKLSGVGVPHNYVRLWVAVCVTFFTVQSLLKATIYL